MPLKRFRSIAEETGILIGNILLPMVIDLLESVRGLFERFNALDESTQRMIIAFAGIAAAIGPLLIIMGKSILAIQEIRKAMGLLNLTMLANPVVLVTAAIVALAAGIALATRTAIIHRRTQRRNAELMLENNEVTKATTIAIASMGEVTLATADAQLRLTETLIG